MRTHSISSSLPEAMRPATEVFAALGDMTRQRILLLFEPGEELSIKDITGQFELGRSTIVHHLAILEKSGILTVRRQGRLALYTPHYEPVLSAMKDLHWYIEEDLRILAERQAGAECGNN